MHLAKMLYPGAIVPLMDKITNDLDVDTLCVLEDALFAVAYCVRVIFRERKFPDRIVMLILSFEGEGHVEWLEENYATYKADPRRRLGEAASNIGH